MAVNYTDFDKVWASASPLTPYEFSENQYKEGWNFVGATPPSRQMWDAFMKQADEKLKYLYDHEDIPVGHEYFTMNPNIPQGSLPLLGGEYSRETYTALWTWVQQQTGYLKTEAEWQTLSASNNGNVPYYSDGDGSTTFRVPSLHCWIKGSDGSAQLVGSYLQAGLPNIEGTIFDNYGGPSGANSNGAFTTIPWSFGPRTGSESQFYFGNTEFDASKSNSIYGNANTVQPESIVGMWLVKAYGTIVDTGTIDEQAYIDDRFNASKQYTDTQVNAVKSTQLAGLTFHTWSGVLPSDAAGRIQRVAPLTDIPLTYLDVNEGEEYTALFTANVRNDLTVYTALSPFVGGLDHWVITIVSDDNYSNKLVGDVELTLTWATAIK